MSRPRHSVRPAPKKKSKKCGNKWRYPDQLRAIMALTNASTSRDIDLLVTGQTRRTETRVYHCPTCGGWHLTSKATYTPVIKPEPTHVQTVPEPLPPMPTHIPSGNILRDMFAATQRQHASELALTA